MDSVLFLSLAFGSLDFLAGQMIGKGWALLAALPVVHWLRERDRLLEIGAAWRRLGVRTHVGRQKRTVAARQVADRNRSAQRV